MLGPCLLMDQNGGREPWPSLSHVFAYLNFISVNLSPHTQVLHCFTHQTQANLYFSIMENFLSVGDRMQDTSAITHSISVGQVT